MRQALGLAESAASAGEVPVGALVVDSSGQVIAGAANAVETRRDATAHAELLALQAAMQVRGGKNLDDCDLYVTLEPCAMCAGAIAHARIRRLYYGASDTKGGAVEHGPRFFTQSTCHHRPEVYSGIEELAAESLLKSFFARLREKTR